MQIARNKKGFSLVLFNPERVFLERILTVILANYSSQPGELHPRGASAWFPSGMEDNDSESVEDREFWVEDLQGYRSSNAALCRAWLQHLQESAEQEPMTLMVPLAQSEVFMQVINDHRIYLAACHDITDHDMDLNWHKMEDNPKRHALLEIHFLAVIIEGMLQGGTHAP